jgi:putative membrane protein
MFYVAFSLGYVFESVGIAIFFAASISVSIITAHVFTRAVDDVGVEAFQTSTTTILKAFLANWMENLTVPLERLFEKFGKEGKVEFSLLGFKTDGSVGPVIVVSSFHPGPFKNVGSSLLPSMIQAALEKNLGYVVSVPHGLFGHEFDLSSQRENQKVLEAIISAAFFSEFTPEATKFVRVQRGVASASCQLFGGCALLTLTLAPETTEDFPQEVGDSILTEAAKLGLRHVVIINAHNSISNPFNVNTVLESLEETSLEALKTASESQPSSFEVGAAKIVPKGFSVEDGIGPGGICAIVFRVDGQVSAYVTIDGNNMVSGLREKILISLKELGIQNGEILTTDTHGVNAVVMTARGYYPLGEAIPHERLINDVKGTVAKALDDMKPASAAWRSGIVPNVKIIGEKQIKEMSLLADKAVQKAKKVAIPLFTVAGLVLVALLTIF